MLAFSPAIQFAPPQNQARSRLPVRDFPELNEDAALEM
jgi:hypothetical protein